MYQSPATDASFYGAAGVRTTCEGNYMADFNKDKETLDQLHALTRPKNSGMLNKAISTGKTDQTASGRHKWFWLAQQDTSNPTTPRPYQKD